ncbi:MAG: hypothetical protein KIS84_06455, partial [Dokdonella sp.]|nr:hypothetical protein [Dokdonella sp.]
MVENALAVVGLTFEQFSGGGSRLAEHVERIVELATQVEHLANLLQGAGAAGKGVGIELPGVLRRVVGQCFLADRIEGGELAVRFEFPAQVAEHELDQAFGMAPLRVGFATRGDRHHGEGR